MAIKAVAGSPIQLIAQVLDKENQNAVPGLPIVIERYDQPAAGGVRIGGGVTDSSGQFALGTNLPPTPGVVEYGASTPGAAGVAKSGQSRRVSIDVVVV